jgi:HEAT repeat protein
VCEANYDVARAQYLMAVEAKNKDLSKAKDALAKSTCPPAKTTKLQAAIAKAEKGEQAVEAAPKDDDEKPKGPDMATVHKGLSNTGNAEARKGAARQMVAFGAEAVPYLIPLVNGDGDLGVRTAVAKALGAIGAPAAKACAQLAKEIADSGERMVLPIESGGKKATAEDEMKRFSREKELQAACREARAKIGCK